MGERNYRFASWSIDADLKDAPSVVIDHGKYIAEGSGGNHPYVFTQNQIRYECFVIVLGASDSPPAILYFFEGKQELLAEAAIKIKN